MIGAFAVIFGLEGQALSAHFGASFDWVQAYSFMLFTLIYTPCLSTIATLRAESNSNKFALVSLDVGAGAGVGGEPCVLSVDAAPWVLMRVSRVGACPCAASAGTESRQAGNPRPAAPPPESPP